MLGYLGVFFSALLSATLLPFYSEAVLLSQLQHGVPILLWVAATAGNTLGAWINWLLGRGLRRFENHRWFYFKPTQLARASATFQRFGLWTLLFAWLPIVGDPLTLVAGVMRVHWLPFILLVGLGKALRYGVVIALSTAATGSL